MKIICIGRNYAAHAVEMKSDAPKEPVFFLKPETALLRQGKDLVMPNFSSVIHHEIELVLRVSKTGKNIALKDALGHFDAIGLGLDLTARDFQAECKKEGLPWEKAKAFDSSAPIGKFEAKENFADLSNIAFDLEINGQIRQKGNSSQLLFPFDVVISHVSKFITLEKGDLIFTGTPEGIGPIKAGDRLIGKIREQVFIDLKVRDELNNQAY